MSGSGRWTPPPEQVQADAAVDGNRTSRWALWISVIFSILALLVSIGSLVEQKSINEEQRRINADQRRAMDDQRRAIDDQIRANDESRTDESMEYAIRVSWWLNPNGDVLTIQNRSTVPIRDVTLRYKAMSEASQSTPWENLPIYDGSPVIYQDVIAPCTSLSIDALGLRKKYEGEPPEYGVYGFTTLAFVRVDFIDAHGSWSIGVSGEEPQILKVEDRLEFKDGDWPFPPEFMEEQPASDCGSG
ncbi:hypothetical protein [Modestobacter altitudinis]|uniref:hypothetical protein n=1 Tax=Modestobacter altitudinis TaxID=2213158 RepID=UPI00110CEB32|nr:hypothetical protein [Modestobacter altitudinis]